MPATLLNVGQPDPVENGEVCEVVISGATAPVEGLNEANTPRPPNSVGTHTAVSSAAICTTLASAHPTIEIVCAPPCAL